MWYLFYLKLSDQFTFNFAMPMVHNLGMLAKTHILTTNVCLWIKILTKETVVFVLEHHIKNHIITPVDDFTLPPFNDSCMAFRCFSNLSVRAQEGCANKSRSMW